MGDTPFLLAYSDTGEGQTIVLIHGFLESHTMWDFLDLESNFRVVCIDLPGHGNSKKCPPISSIERTAQCLKMTLDHLNLSEFHIIGHSLGGYAGLSFLEQFGLNGILILLNSNHWQDDEKKQADRLRVANLALKNKRLFIREAIPGLFSYPEKFPEEIEKLKQEAFEIPAAHIAAFSVAMRNRKNQLKTLKKHSKKISILQGESDKLCPHERMEIDVSRLMVDYTIIPNAGHMSFIENTSFVRNSIFQLLG